MFCAEKLWIGELYLSFTPTNTPYRIFSCFGVCRYGFTPDGNSPAPGIWVQGWFVLNKVMEDTRETMLEAVADSQKIGAVIPADAKVAAAGLTGAELTGTYPAIQDLARKLMEGGIQ